jgi:imidazoleglycerol-phosphate dehydratase
MLNSRMARAATIDRKTSETDIQLSLEVDGAGASTIRSGIPFFDHMLTLFARHGLFDLQVTASGDLDVDLHHTVEDVGIVLGQAFTKALGNKKGIRRYGHAYVPMDETLVRAVVDLSGRPFLEYRAPGGVEPINGFSFQLVEEFLRGFTMNAAANVHIEILYGRDAHHMAEGVFKALARALDTATQLDPRVTGVPSTKGVL